MSRSSNSSNHAPSHISHASTSHTRRILHVISPASDEVLDMLMMDDSSSINEKYTKAKNAQKIWASLSLSSRKQPFLNFFSLFTKNSSSLALLICKETGCPLGLSKLIIESIIPRMEFFLKTADDELREEQINNENMPVNVEKTIQKWEPRGVIGYLGSWNSPILMFCDFICPLLLCGNGCLIKPSELCTLTCLELLKLFYESGFPKDLLPVIIGDYQVGEQLTDLNLDSYFMFGSYNSAKIIAEKISPTLIPFSAQLGGKDAFLICSDANLEIAAYKIARGKFIHSGQSYDAVDRLFVEEKIYDEFIKLLIEQVQKLPFGDPLNEDTIIGPLCTKQQIKILEEMTDDALKKGGKILYKGEKPKDLNKGNYFAPTIIGDVSIDCRLFLEETFGPLLGIYRVSSTLTDEQIISLMNRTNYGLTAGIFTQNQERANKLAEHLNVGTIHINNCCMNLEWLIWSGRKKSSGLGKMLSKNTFKQNFLKPKSYIVGKVEK